MDAVKEAVLEQKVDHLAVRMDERFVQVDTRFGRLEDRLLESERQNHEEHVLIRSEIRELRGDMKGLNRTLVLGFGSIVASLLVAIVTNAV